MNGPLRLLHTSTFRLALVYMALFAASALVLVAFLYWATTGSILRQSDATIEAEVQGLAEQYRRRGTAGVASVVAERLRRDPSSPELYLLADFGLRPLAGNLSGWPAAQPGDGGWVEFTLEDRTQGAEAHRARGRVFALATGAHLLVGRDMYEIDRLSQRFLHAVGWGMGVTFLLALAGGAAMSRSTVRRIEAINRTSRRIMRGDLKQRIATDGTDDEFDQLADNLNRMLDRIAALMEGVRRVSDHIAHDLRTPLTRLRGKLERLRQSVRGDTALALADESLAETDRLLRLFAALLRIARSESGSRPRDETVELAALARDAVELYEASAEAKELALSFELAPGLTVRGDRDLLFQALANLLDNAVKYTPAQGTVRLRVAREADTATLVVEDSGPGIPAAARDGVVERFSRLDRDRGLPGEGLGLVLVDAVARQHGGALRLEDAGPGLRAVLALPIT